MPTKFRLANKTQWSLDALEERLFSSRKTVSRIVEWTTHYREDAMLKMDKAMLANLGRLDHDAAKLALLMAEMEQIVRDARVGVFRQE